MARGPDCDPSGAGSGPRARHWEALALSNFDLSLRSKLLRVIDRSFTVLVLRGNAALLLGWKLPIRWFNQIKADFRCLT